MLRTLVRAVVLAVALWLPQTGVVTVQILAINDFHGNLEPPSGSTGQINGTPAGGAEYLAAHLARAVAENPNSIIVGAGDKTHSPVAAGPQNRIARID